MHQVIQQLSETIRKAVTDRVPLRIRGSGSKDFYGLALTGEVLDTRSWTGVEEYEPTELVLTARTGTPLGEIEATLANKGQMLAFEPAHFGPHATLGGCIACGFSGPRRACAGSVRDFVLGVRMLNGKGEALRFGGQVMKNVAGYDLSRLVTASFGTLGLITEVSLKVLPLPELESTIRFEMDETTAIASMNRWAARPLPISGTCHTGNLLSVRLSGAAPAVAAALNKLGGEEVADARGFWQSVREHTHPFFSGTGTLWRMSIKATAAPLGLGPQLIEWNGSLRWVIAGHGSARMHDAAGSAGGHATLFRGSNKRDGIQRLTPAAVALHRKLKHALDPEGIFGPGRIHADF